MPNLASCQQVPLRLLLCKTTKIEKEFNAGQINCTKVSSPFRRQRLLKPIALLQIGNRMTFKNKLFAFAAAHEPF